MIGRVIDGYKVTEIVASTKVGLLYEARHQSSGQRAILRVTTQQGELRMVEIFAAEARAFFDTGASEVVEGQLDDGTRYLLLRAPTPGSGRTRHPHTQRLGEPEPESVERRRPGPSWLTVVALVALALGAGLVTALTLSSNVPRDQARAGPPAAVAPTAPPPSGKGTGVPAATTMTPPSALIPDAGVAPVAIVRVAPPTEPVSGKRQVILQEECDPDESWKKNRLRDLDDLAALAAERNVIPALEMESIERSLSSSIRGAVSRADCMNVQRAIEAARQRLVGR
jgi:hypothetical protein